MAKKKADPVNPWFILLTFMTMGLTAVALFLLFKEEEEPEPVQVIIGDDDGETSAIESLLSGQGLFPEYGQNLGILGWII